MSFLGFVKGSSTAWCNKKQLAWKDDVTSDDCGLTLVKSTTFADIPYSGVHAVPGNTDTDHLDFDLGLADNAVIQTAISNNGGFSNYFQFDIPAFTITYNKIGDSTPIGNLEMEITIQLTNGSPNMVYTYGNITYQISGESCTYQIPAYVGPIEKPTTWPVKRGPTSISVEMRGTNTNNVPAPFAEYTMVFPLRINIWVLQFK